jgi:hypothetical protein
MIFFQLSHRLKDTLKNVKPRVDTHWKKAPSQPAVQAVKVMTRSESLKSLLPVQPSAPTARLSKAVAAKSTINRKYSFQQVLDGLYFTQSYSFIFQKQ